MSELWQGIWKERKKRKGASQNDEDEGIQPLDPDVCELGVKKKALLVSQFVW